MLMFYPQCLVKSDPKVRHHSAKVIKRIGMGKEKRRKNNKIAPKRNKSRKMLGYFKLKS